MQSAFSSHGLVSAEHSSISDEIQKGTVTWVSCERDSFKLQHNRVAEDAGEGLAMSVKFFLTLFMLYLFRIQIIYISSNEFRG